MKIWHQSMGSVQLNNVGDGIQKHAALVVEPGTEVSVHGMPGKPDYVVSLESIQNGSAPEGSVTTMDVYGTPYLNRITLGRIVDQARQAEKEGYDAFVIGSWTDPYVREMRSLVNIPVISTLECNVLIACSLGKLQGHICLNPSIARLVTDHVHDLMLSDRVAYVSSLGPDVDEWTIQKAWNDPKELLDRFRHLAEEAIRVGADVIIPAEGIITEFIYSHGLKKIGKAPVLDTFGLAWKYAEFLVNLKKTTGLEVGREWEYRQASSAQLTRVRAGSWNSHA